MSEIDWSKAPEDATHHIAENNSTFECWLKPGYAVRVSRGSSDWVRNDYADKLIADCATERPTTPSWSGEGLPPVGTVCERRFIDSDDEKWSLMDVLCHGKTTIYYRDRNGTEWSHYINDLEFRPIRTPEQIAADEREAAIKEMTAGYAKNSDTLAGWAAYVYDTLGYRKP